MPASLAAPDPIDAIRAGGTHAAEALRPIASRDDAAPVRVALRLAASIDAEALGDELARLWTERCALRRGAARVELSVVETCGRSPAERERDALRLLDAETRAVRPAGTLRATLVSLGTRDHLLLLAAAPGALALQALGRTAADLERLYPLAAFALG